MGIVPEDGKKESRGKCVLSKSEDSANCSEYGGKGEVIDIQ